MILKRVLKKEFFITLFFKQNRWHNHGVFIHTLLVVFYAIKNRRLDMIAAAFLHDIGKPLCAYQDDEDMVTSEYSFTNHEEISYQIIKNWFFISDFTKELVRHHYLLRGMANAKRKKQTGKYNRMERIYTKLDKKFLKDLEKFLIFDDLAKE